MGQSVKRFQLFNGLDTALYKNILLVRFLHTFSVCLVIHSRL